MELRIVNPELGFSKAPLVEPTESRVEYSYSFRWLDGLPVRGDKTPAFAPTCLPHKKGVLEGLGL